MHLKTYSIALFKPHNHNKATLKWLLFLILLVIEERQEYGWFNFAQKFINIPSNNIENANTGISTYYCDLKP